MKYFNTLPKILSTNYNGGTIVLTNLLARANILPELLKNPLLYYTYDIQEGDTPEIVAHKYYNDMYRYWIVLMCNQLLDPQWNWPLNSQQFQDYLTDKYGTQDIYGTVHNYQEIITQFDYGTQTTTVNTIQITQDTYNSFVNSTNTYTLPTGQVKVTKEAKAISIFDYEVQQNEAKRKISILNNQYVDQIEQQFLKLVS